MNLSLFRFTNILLLLVVQIQLAAQSTSWTIEFPVDNFTDDAILDLSSLNEVEAGENGFISLSADGESFANSKGEVRFWAIGGGDDTRAWTDDQLAQFAKFLAKRGVNMIRTHAKIHSTTNDINVVNKDEVDAIWRLVAAMKAEGIYTTISPFWAGHMSNIPEAWGLGDYKGNVKPWALMYFEPKFKDAYKKWLEYLFSEVNPYTGKALKDEPAVGLIQMKNEDGIFFWTIQDVKPSLMAIIQSKFYNWLINKYGTIEQAYTTWQNLAPISGDDPANEKMGVYIIWEATQNRTGGQHKRITDQINFYSDIQKGFYQEIYDHLKAIGCKQLINANNWKTADAKKLFDAERYTNSVADVMAVNRYYDPQHIGENSGWRIDPGHQYVGASVLKNPHKLPINVKQVKGKPFIVSESAWNLPHKYQAEGPFLIAAYSSLTGFDAYYWFTPRSPGFDTEPYFTWTTLSGGQHPLSRWNVSTPGQVGMFPANALMYRKGLIQKAGVMVHENRTLNAIYERKMPVISEDNSFDPNRDSYNNTGGSTTETKVAPIAYLTGQVTVSYNTASDSETISPQLNQLLDFQNKKIKSATGQLNWDYSKGMCLLDAPAAQGICGFPGTDTKFNLSAISVETTNEYVVVNVVSYDNKPLSTSDKVFIQTGTVYRPTGWTERVSNVTLGTNNSLPGFTIENTGTMPWKANSTLASVTIQNPNIQSAWLLDINGYEVKEIPVQRIDANQIKIFLPTDAMYVMADTRASTITGSRKKNIGGFKIYPNPTEGKFIIAVESTTSDYETFEILDLSGKSLKTFNRISTEYEVKLPAGMYFMYLRKNGQVVHQEKIILN